ncbi:MAG: peptide deformylase [Nitrospinae bacterium]|nr:peptide deformylase [Nitrospinota bacterium]
MRKIITYPDGRLREKSAAVDSFDDPLKNLAGELREIVSATNAMGVSAPQIGVFQRVIAVQREKGGILVLANPVISKEEGIVTDKEGCLSMPGFYIDLPRPARVTVTGFTVDGMECRYHATGYFARAAAHEIDHLDGILMWDHLEQEQRETAISSYLKLSLKH